MGFHVFGFLERLCLALCVDRATFPFRCLFGDRPETVLVLRDRLLRQIVVEDVRAHETVDDQVRITTNR